MHYPATLAERMNGIEKESTSFWKDVNPSDHSCFLIKTLLEDYAARQNWEKIISLSSKATLHLNQFHKRNIFYQIWISSLNESFDHDSLNELGDHLFRMTAYHSTYTYLALMAYILADNKKMTQNLYASVKECKIKNIFQAESLALYFASKGSVTKSISLYQKVIKTPSSTYFTWRNYLRILSENQRTTEMARVYNEMHKKFPYAAEPYIVAALTSMKEHNWPEAIKMFQQLLRDHPKHKDYILGLSLCYEKIKEDDAALSILLEHADLYDNNSYDYQYAIARLLKNKLQFQEDEDLLKQTVLHFEKSIQLGTAMGLPTEKLKEELLELHYYKKEYPYQSKTTEKALKCEKEESQNSVVVLNTRNASTEPN